MLTTSKATCTIHCTEVRSTTTKSGNSWTTSWARTPSPRPWCRPPGTRFTGWRFESHSGSSFRSLDPEQSGSSRLWLSTFWGEPFSPKTFCIIDFSVTFSSRRLTLFHYRLFGSLQVIRKRILIRPQLQQRLQLQQLQQWLQWQIQQHLSPLQLQKHHQFTVLP